jgi:serine/threonine protein kinase/peptidoglycan hydrolase-like protein with peptidoglycan-binding domain
MAGQAADANQDDFRGALPSGTLVRDYELVAVLGQGGFGITYRARDHALDREVAIKEYLPTALALREATMVVPRSTKLAEDFVWGRQRFLDEARILATLSHVPAVVRVFNYLESNGTAYMVMELARGETLDQRLQRVGTLPADTIALVLGRLLDGLEAVHHTGFLHRDVKPANIILDANDNPTLIDFGASRAAITDRTAGLTAMFTPRYAAVEQLTSAKQGPWTDIYSVSATLYHAIIGEPPPSSLERVLNDTHKPLSRLQPSGYPPRLLHGLDAALGLRPEARPQSIAEWRRLLTEPRDADLESTVFVRRSPTVAAPTVQPPTAAAESNAVEAVAPPARAEPTFSPSARRDARPVVRALGGAVVVLLLLLGGYGIYAVRSPPASPPHETVPNSTGPDDAAAQRQRADAARQAAEGEARRKADADAKATAEREAHQRAEAEAKAKAEEEARRKAETEAKAKAEQEAHQRAEAEAKAKAKAEEEARLKAEAQAKADAEAKAEAEAEARRKADAADKLKADAAARAQEETQARARAETEAREKAEADARQKAGAEAKAKAEAEARQKAEADAKAKADAEAKAKAEAAARQKTEAEATAKAEAEAQQKAQAEAKAQADAAAKAKAYAEAAEAALNLSPQDRMRVQVALNGLGFDTEGVDGVLGARSREMIERWQQARSQAVTGYLTATQQQALLHEAAPALAKWDDARKAAEAAAKARANAAAAAASATATPATATPATPSAPPPPARSGGGVSCQDKSGERIDIPNASVCPYGLVQVR